MEDKDKVAEVVASLRSEIVALRASSENLMFSFDRIINFALVFLVGGAGVALTTKHFIVMALLPFPVVIILGYLLGLNVEGLSRAGHKRALEERLNSIIGEVFVEESYVAPMRQGKHRYGRLGVVTMQGMLGLLLLVLFGFGFAAVVDKPDIYIALYSFGFVYSLVSLGGGIAELDSSYMKSYNVAKSSMVGGGLPPSAQLPDASATPTVTL